MRVVVTGGAGFLGSHVCELLLDRGDEVVAVDNLCTGTTDNLAHLMARDGFRFVHHDVSRHLDVPGQVDAVMHLASPASPRDYVARPLETLKVNSLGTLHTLDLARDKGARYFFASTSEVYGDPAERPISPHRLRRRQPDEKLLLRRRPGARVGGSARLRPRGSGEHRQSRRVHGARTRRDRSGN